MSVENVRKYLEKFGLGNRVQEFDVSSATVELAALALDCKPGEIAKTLSFIVKDKPILVVAAGNQKISNSKFKQCFNEKAKMIRFDEVEMLIGHRVGGVCPFAVKDGVETFLDVSLKKYEMVYPACGSANSAIALSIEELEKCSNFTAWVDVCQDQIKE